MGFYLNREDFNRTFAKKQYQIQHEATISGSDKRSSFYRINNEEELLAASQHWAHFPAMVMVGLSVGFANKDDSIRQSTGNSILFVEKLQLNQANPVEADAISASYDRTLEIVYDYISYIQKDLDENQGCGTFKSLEPERIRIEQEGPVGDQLYGWVLTFPDETYANRAMIYDASHFIEP